LIKENFASSNCPTVRGILIKGNFTRKGLIVSWYLLPYS